MKTLTKILAALCYSLLFTILGFAYGLYFPWDDLVQWTFTKQGTKRFYFYSLPGRILGMIVCSIVFAVVGFVTGLLFPWILDKDSSL